MSKSIIYRGINQIKQSERDAVAKSPKFYRGIQHSGNRARSKGQRQMTYRGVSLVA